MCTVYCGRWMGWGGMGSGIDIRIRIRIGVVWGG